MVSTAYFVQKAEVKRFQENRLQNESVLKQDQYGIKARQRS